MKASVGRINGVSELLIDGETASRTWARPDLPGRDALHKIEQYLPSGINVHIIALDGWETTCWDGEGQDFYPYERLMARLLKRDPNLLLIPCLGFRTGVPYIWCRRHEEELMATQKGRRYSAGSYASTKWIADSSAVLQNFVSHFAHGPFADHIAGYNLVSNGNEWFGNQPVGEKWGLEMLDYSRPMRAYFRDYLKAKYAEDAALQEAWRDAGVTLATAEIPAVEDRMYTFTEGFFGHREGVRMRVADYTGAYNEAHAGVACAYAAAMKAAMPEPKLIGLMGWYSYCG